MTVPTPEEILRAAGVTFSSFSHPPIRSYEDIQRILRLPADQLLKTMAFRVADGFVLAAVPGAARVAYGPLARTVGVSRSALRQADASDLEALGMEPGGVSPVTDRQGTRVVFDSSVRQMTRVYCGSGRTGQTIEIKADVLIATVRPVFGDITR